MKKIIYVLLLVAILVGGFYFLSDVFNKTKTVTEEVTEQKSTKVEESTDKKMASQASDAESQLAYTPAIWKIEHKGKTSYLFGSIHVGEKNMYPLPENVMQAFSETEVLAVEANIANVNQMEMARMVQEMAMDLENPLPTVLSERTREQYEIFCKKQSSTCNMVKIFEPWMAAMTIEAMSVIQLGYSEDLGIDKFFINGSKEKEIVELESLEGQLKLLDGMPKELQDYMVLGAVTKDANDFKDLMKSWKTGQMEQVMAQAEADSKAMGIPEDVMNEFNDLFLYKRNKVMADGIAAQMEQGKSVFAVVGAAHYAGKNSVQQYLEEKGFTIERL